MKRKGFREDEKGLNAEAEGKPVIWVIDLEHWPRAYLGAELIERGYDVTGFPELDQALAELRREYRPRPSAIVLELRDQKIMPRALELLACTKVPIVGIAGMIEFNNPLIREFKWAKLLRRPVSIGEVADAVEECLRRLRE
jgi:hypothetical protein